MLNTAAISASSADRRPWIILPSRMLLFIFFQALIALGFALTGSADAWQASAAWWPWTVTLGNMVCLYLLVNLFRGEGLNYWDLFRFDRKKIKNDLLVLVPALIITGPVAMMPSTWISTALFGDLMVAMRVFLSPLPPLGIFAAVVLFPVTQGMVELAFYFFYAMPRLAKQVNPWAAYAIACLFLGIQHLAIPLVLDGRFITWRGLMFIPFAFFIGAVLKFRPSLLPYLAVVHVLMDMGTGLMYLMPF